MDTIRTSALLQAVHDLLPDLQRRAELAPLLLTGLQRRAELAPLLLTSGRSSGAKLRSTAAIRYRLPFLLLALCCVGLPAAAQDASWQDAALGEEWRPIDPARLAGMRGGLQMPSGTVLSFGIERVVHVNGQLVASVSLRIPDLSRVDAAQAQAIADFNEGILVQVGEGNHFDPSRIPGGGVVIQNTLDNQNISTATYIDLGAGALDIFQNLNSSAALSDALMRAPGTP
jgi:hypothetical protein